MHFKYKKKFIFLVTYSHTISMQLFNYVAKGKSKSYPKSLKDPRDCYFLTIKEIIPPSISSPD